MIDTNILIRGSTFPRLPYEILCHATRGDFKSVLSPTVIAEAKYYMKELFPQHLHRLNTFLNLLPYEPVEDPTEEEERFNQDLVRDPKDVPIALAAIKAKVDYLVSTDKDLTDLDESTEKLRLLIRPIKPWAFLEEVMGWNKEELKKISKRHWKEIERKT